MLRTLNVKMLILIDGQKVIHHTGVINEFIAYRYYFRTSLLH